MTLKTRLTLVFLGFVTFLIIAPMVVLLARGYYFDVQSGKIVKTGIVVLKTQPKGAKIFLNGKKMKNTPAVIRFLKPGEYEVKLQKDGFRDWQKRISILEERVSYLPQTQEASKIWLFLQAPLQTFISSSTQDFLLQKEKIFFLEQDQILSLNLETTEKKLVATTTLNYLEPKLLGLETVETEKKYYISSATNHLVAKTPEGKELKILNEKLPLFAKSQLVLSPTNQIFLLLDAHLYEVGEGLQKIGQQISFASWDEDLEGLVFGNEHEIWTYEPLRKTTPQLLTRSLKNLSLPKYNKATGYLFFAENHELKAYEYDNSGQPNTYILAETKNPNAKLAVDSDGSKLIFLDGQNLYTLKIR